MLGFLSRKEVGGTPQSNASTWKANSRTVPSPFAPHFAVTEDFKKLPSECSFHSQQRTLLGATTPNNTILPLKRPFSFPPVYSLTGERAAERSRGPTSEISSALDWRVEAISLLPLLLSALKGNISLSMPFFFFFFFLCSLMPKVCREGSKEQRTDAQRAMNSELQKEKKNHSKTWF